MNTNKTHKTPSKHVPVFDLRVTYHPNTGYALGILTPQLNGRVGRFSKEEAEFANDALQEYDTTFASLLAACEDMENARAKGLDLPWGTVRAAIAKAKP